MTRSHLLFLLAGSWASLGAAYRTDNFVVEAPDAQTARQIGEAAEKCRHDKAVLWLGQPMPRWKKACPLTVRVTMGGPGGATSFQFDQGRVLRQNMEVNGPVGRMLASVLPHEVTHTVFAHYFRQPVPRWADEGGAVLSEDEQECRRHDTLVRQLLNQGRAVPLARLFPLKDYPRDVMVLYAEGYSVARFLVEKKDRKTFLAFVAHGMSKGWNKAARKYYNYKNVDRLELAWRSDLKRTKEKRLREDGPTVGLPSAYRNLEQSEDAPLSVPIVKGETLPAPAPHKARRRR
jgi:hypothetical protein